MTKFIGSSSSGSGSIIGSTVSGLNTTGLSENYVYRIFDVDAYGIYLIIDGLLNRSDLAIPSGKLYYSPDSEVYRRQMF